MLQERLDRGLSNEEWLYSWPNTCITHLTRTGSNHCPLLVTTIPMLTKGRKLFRFKSYWAEEPKCKEVISNQWALGIGPTMQKKRASSLYHCRTGLQRWSRTKFPNNKKKIKNKLAELESLQCESQRADNLSRQKALNASLCSLWQLEESFWKQRSRVNWLLTGDANTKFFHLFTIQRRQRNRIQKITSADGGWITDKRLIQHAFQSHFHNIFTSSGNRSWGNTIAAILPVITDDMNNKLTAPFSLEEIHKATFQMALLQNMLHMTVENRRLYQKINVD